MDFESPGGYRAEGAYGCAAQLLANKIRDTWFFEGFHEFFFTIPRAFEEVGLIPVYARMIRNIA